MISPGHWSIANYRRPQDAPPTILAGNGAMLLRRYRVEAVVYAHHKRVAQNRLEHAKIYLDAARIVPDRPDLRQAAEAVSEAWDTFIGDADAARNDDIDAVARAIAGLRRALRGGE